MIIVAGLVCPAPHAASADPQSADRGRNLAELLRLTSGPLTIGGLGSSVGRGETLPDPATQAPVAYFASQLVAHTDRSPSDVRVVNGSVNGSTIHDGLTRDWPVLRARHPDVVVLAYGMNDGAPAQFNSGETYPGALADLSALLTSIARSGAVAVVLTSPHPDVDRIKWDAAITPLLYPGPGDTAVPGRAGVPEIIERKASGTTIRVSARHAIVNAGMMSVARAHGVDVVDVQPDWYRAVARLSAAALFNPSEYVHPNLTGHRLSYDRAIRRWFGASRWALPAVGRGADALTARGSIG